MLFSGVRVTMDIMQAYLIGKAEETVDALVAEIYADIVEDFEMGNFGE